MQIQVSGKPYEVNISLGTFRVIKEIGMMVQKSGGTSKEIMKQADEIDEMIGYVLDNSVTPVPEGPELRTEVFNTLTSLTKKFVSTTLSRTKKS